jgi:hypothetical protein
MYIDEWERSNTIYTNGPMMVDIISSENLHNDAQRNK